ncbi:hypothetical protein D3C71_1937710 [compost metagenome]
MLRPAQQIEQRLVVVFARGLQRGQTHGELAFKIGHHKALCQKGVAHQLVDHTGVL